MNSLIERRAEFVYNAARLAAIGSNAPIVPVIWAEREDSFKNQFLKVIARQCGDQRPAGPDSGFYPKLPCAGKESRRGHAACGH